MSDRAEHRRRGTEPFDPLTDHPVGPDDAGNAVMHGVGLLVGAWHWIVRRVRGRG